MPLRNRVTPFGEIVAVPGRGLLMGNRGVLHDAQQHIVRDSQVRRWIACVLEFRGRHRALMQPNRWTELFFLDEAAAFAAGHRPCAECRRADFERFKHAWQQAHGNGPWSADAIDAQLHPERRAGPWRKRTFTADVASLPEGTYVALDDQPWLIHADALYAWSPDRYTARRLRHSVESVTVLTPPSLVAVLRKGYVPMLHPSAKL
ncbi:MAG TPA: hypothetical protein VGL99_33135 [Chloroflexota bacterium]|jgi:hypothetical protein